jgi:protein gp37
MGQANYVNGFSLSLHEGAVELPLRWKTPQTIFVNSMSDLFHADVPLEFIQRLFDVMRQAHWHRFQILTKRAERLRDVALQLDLAPNIWMGVSVETNDYLYRVEHLRAAPAAIRFLSLEPLLGPLPDIQLDGIHWVITGGESGPGARQVQAAWVTDIRDRCLSAHVPFFFKQWGGVQKKRAGRSLDGRTWDEMPEAA